MCATSPFALLQTAGAAASTKKIVVDPLTPVKPPGFGTPKLLDAETTKKAALASAEAQKLKAIAAYSLSDTKHTGPKGLGSTPNGNKLYAELLGG